MADYSLRSELDSTATSSLGRRDEKGTLIEERECRPQDIPESIPRRQSSKRGSKKLRRRQSFQVNLSLRLSGGVHFSMSHLWIPSVILGPPVPCPVMTWDRNVHAALRIIFPVLNRSTHSSFLCSLQRKSPVPGAKVLRTLQAGQKVTISFVSLDHACLY